METLTVGDTYQEFLQRKSQIGGNSGFEPIWMPDFLKDFQASIDEWAIRKGRASIFADCGLGKGLRPDCPVLTATGFKPLSEIKVGDDVIGANGKTTTVTGVFHRGLQPLYRVTFDDGVSVVCDSDHLWNVKSYNDVARDKPWRTMSVSDLAATKLKYGTHGQSRTWQIPLVKAVDHPESNLPIHPYLLGVLLGDGHCNGMVSWCKPDEEIADRVKPLLPDGVELVRGGDAERAAVWKIIGTQWQKNPVLDAMRNIGLDGKRSWEKFAPPQYLVASVSDRIALLQGLMDTDGYAGESPEFSSASERLAKAVVQLVESLGGTASLNMKEEPTYIYHGETKTGRPSYRVVFTLPPGINPFSLPRKANAYKPAGRGLGRWIDSIEPVGEGETICIKVDAPDGLFVIDRYVVTHNTPMFLVWAENVVRKTNRPVLVLAPLAVSHQIVKEGEKFGVEVHRSIDGQAQPNITVTNYERLPKFSPDDFSGVVCDEASIIKHWTGATQKAVTRFLSKLQYRLLCTATPAPNDFTEMGTASEALGELTHSDMLATFFRQLSDVEKKRRATATDIIHSRRLSWRVLQSMGQWVLRAHAFEPFWKWASSWAIACRKPSDVGPFDDKEFVLPAINRFDHTVSARTPPLGFLFNVPAFGLNQERAERRRTLDERTELVVKLTENSDSAVVWCHLNPEGDRLEKEIRGAVQVKGSQSMEQKEELILAFLNGEARVLVTKAKIAGLGLNLQHCAHVVTFVDHSYEKFYQCIRRCWRFGQKRPVRLDVISTEGEVNVKRNMHRKEAMASQMFDSIIAFMNESQTIRPKERNTNFKVPKWMNVTTKSRKTTRSTTATAAT